MLNRINTYFASTKNYLFSKLLRKKSHSSTQGLCCIDLAPQEFTIVYVREIAGKKTIELCESHPYDKNNLSQILTTIVKNKNLKNVACSWMLQPEDYQLLITDALPVTKTEFQAAIRWKIKDLIRYPLNDLVVDSFLMPKMKTSTDKIMVVAAQASKLKLMSDQLREWGLNLKIIDIPELGLRNISVLYEQDEQTLALVYIEESSIQLLITYQQQIYVSRQLKFSLKNEDVNATLPGIERLAAEIQRSFDYYQSLWDQSMPSRIIFSSTKSIAAEATDLLSQRVRVPVEIINIVDTIVCIPKVNVELQGKYLPVIGGALRED